MKLSLVTGKIPLIVNKHWGAASVTKATTKQNLSQPRSHAR